jgi:uncharacterized protein YndB with AHSA1/START domain/catechol 2,3-dioxygenase-like lactoylglutathione lyase family enzyme
MLQSNKAFCSFSVNDLSRAKDFYSNILGLKVTEQNIPDCLPQLILSLNGGGEVLVYPKEDHIPATFTVLNLIVAQIDNSAKELAAQGVRFDRYEGTDETGISHNEGPLIAWFKDPAGNIISIMQEQYAAILDEIKMNKFIPEKKEEVFKFWIRPELVEQWSSPDGMSLKVPKFEARKGGHYRFVHTAKEGTYSCYGFFRDYVPNEKIVQVDTVKGPDGKYVFQNLVSTIEFKQVAGGVEIQLRQNGFPDQESMRQCEESWTQCFNKLLTLISGDMMHRPESGKFSEKRI